MYTTDHFTMTVVVLVYSLGPGGRVLVAYIMQPRMGYHYLATAAPRGGLLQFMNFGIPVLRGLATRPCSPSHPRDE